MKARSIIFIIAIFLIPSLSFAEPKADTTISFHPLPDQEALDTLSSELSRMEKASKEKDRDYKSYNKKLESLQKQRDALDKQELNRQAAYNKCWAACPDALYTGNGGYQCRYSQRCNQCGGNCNSRFIKAREDIERKIQKLAVQIDEVEESLEHIDGDYSNQYNGEETAMAIVGFVGCINGVIDGKAVYKERTYTSLDECLKAQGWEPTSKK